jgi:hypothetical protein
MVGPSRILLNSDLSIFVIQAQSLRTIILRPRVSVQFQSPTAKKPPVSPLITECQGVTSQVRGNCPVPKRIIGTKIALRHFASRSTRQIRPDAVPFIGGRGRRRASAVGLLCAGTSQLRLRRNRQVVGPRMSPCPVLHGKSIRSIGRAAAEHRKRRGSRPLMRLYSLTVPAEGLQSSAESRRPGILGLAS